MVDDFKNWLGSMLKLAENNSENESKSTSVSQDSKSAKETEDTAKDAEQVQKIGAVGKNLSEGEVTPYLKISVGKQSADAIPFAPGYVELTISPSSIEFRPVRCYHLLKHQNLRQGQN